MADRGSDDELRRALSDMWLRRRSEVVTLLSDAADLARRIALGDSTESLRSATHQMVGVLGVYRLNELREAVVSVDEATRVGDDPADAEVIADRLEQLRDAVQRHPGPSPTGEDQ
ncbi:MAG: hypothetical protein LW627_06645 [Ilumatobacteraceae bacterium]|nr:hypothetical protein [Ilumatobacteraceae bacterium]